MSISNIIPSCLDVQTIGLINDNQHWKQSCFQDHPTGRRYQKGICNKNHNYQYINIKNKIR